MSGARNVPCAALALLALACDPYSRFNQSEDDSLGPVDPVNFPPANLGVQDDGSPANRRMSGTGSFTGKAALAGGEAAFYFDHAIPTVDPDADPLRVAAFPLAYVFDPGYQCTPPAGYVPDRRLDEVPLDRQGNIFGRLPDARYSPETGPQLDYVPLVREVVVPPAPAMTCQKPKSVDALARLSGVATADRMPSGRVLAHFIIDPGAGVYPPGQSDRTGHPGLGLQSWGWFNRYLLAYIDGGEMPTREEMVGMPPMTMMVRRMVPQKLYYPRSAIIRTNGMGMTTMRPGALGAGLDLLAAKRGMPGYSPICEVSSYDAGMPLAPEALPRTTAAVEAMFGPSLMPDSPRYVFCLQVVTP